MPRMRMSEVIAQFISEAGKDRPDFYSDYHLQGIEQGRLFGRDAIFSYGRHFPLAVIMPSEKSNRGWWLLNGDRYQGSGGWGRSTSSQQEEVRQLAQGTGLPVMIVSFDALEQAGIRQDTIRPAEVLADRYTWEPRVWTQEGEPRDYEVRGDSVYSTRFWQQRLSDRQWVYEESVHHLGEALFTADYSYSRLAEPARYDFTEGKRYIPAVHENVRGNAYFLSAFDTQEGFGLYFMCQLPAGVTVRTVAEARECLKPGAVVEYEWNRERTAVLDPGRALRGPVLRQGDVFAVPTDWSTRELPGPSKRGEYVLGTNHMATEVRTDGMGSTYARGILRHRPAGRDPDHHAVELGDRKTWFLLVKNTVPEGRAWSMGGYVD